MRKDLLVEILVPAGDDVDVATGYPVGSDLVLTARHVLEAEDRDRDRRILIRWHDYPHGPIDGCFELEPDAVVWQGAGELDAAVLRVPRPADARGQAFISNDRPQPWMEWQSAGFPEASVVRSQSRPSSFGGRLHSMAENWPAFDLDVRSAPCEEKGWRGASGMPIFVGSTIIGLAREVIPKEGPGRIHATPSFKLLEDATFRKLVGYDERVRQHDRVRRELLRLKRSDAACDLLAEKLDEIGRGEAIASHLTGCTSPDKAEILASALLMTPLDEVINALGEARLTLNERIETGDDAEVVEATAALDVLAEASHAVMPFLFDFGVVRKAREKLANGLELIDLPAGIDTVAELVMASVDERKAEFRERRFRDDATGKRALPAPPEGGRDDKAREHFMDYMKGKFSHADVSTFRRAIDDYLAKFLQTSPVPSGGDPSARIKLVADEYERERIRSGGKRYYFIFRVPEEENVRRALASMINDLRITYPAVACVGLSTRAEQINQDRWRFFHYVDLIPFGGAE